MIFTRSVTVQSGQKIAPALWFDNNGDEAVDFYVSIFRNSKIIKFFARGRPDPVRKGQSLQFL